MPLGHCPTCEADGRESLREITPTPEPVSRDETGAPIGTSRRWQLVVHSDGRSGICQGSGTRI